nr:hypothetical protein CFP56_59698 [Quercus suber]
MAKRCSAHLFIRSCVRIYFPPSIRELVIRFDATIDKTWISSTHAPVSRDDRVFAPTIATNRQGGFLLALMAFVVEAQRTLPFRVAIVFSRLPSPLIGKVDFY